MQEVFELPVTSKVRRIKDDVVMDMCLIRMSCDTDAMLNVVIRAIRLLEACGVKPYRVFVYLLVQDIASAERRAIALREVGAEVFAQPYRDFENNVEPTKEMKALARWINRKAIFKSVRTFSEYEPTRRKAEKEDDHG